MQQVRKKYIREMIGLALDEHRRHGHFVCDSGKKEPGLVRVVRDYSRSSYPRPTVCEITAVLVEELRLARKARRSRCPRG